MKGGARVVMSNSKTRAGPAKVLEISPTAVKRLKTLLDTGPPNASAFQLGVKTRGCSGMAFWLDYCDKEKADKWRPDMAVNQDGVKIVVDPNAILHVAGTRMDWIEDPLRAEFIFENPNATGTCGCGESFNIKPPETTTTAAAKT